VLGGSDLDTHDCECDLDTHDCEYRADSGGDPHARSLDHGGNGSNARQNAGCEEQEYRLLYRRSGHPGALVHQRGRGLS
jgi:hypothetical protein